MQSRCQAYPKVRILFVRQIQKGIGVIYLLVYGRLRWRGLPGCRSSAPLLPVTGHKDRPQGQEDDVEEHV